MSEATSKHSVVWVDIPVTDVARAVAFYGAVMGVDIGVTEIPGFRFGLLPHDNGTVGGCLYEAEGDVISSSQGVLIYLNVDGRMNAAVDAVTAHGGKIIEPARAIGEHGFRALVIDSEGNRIALHANSMEPV